MPFGRYTKDDEVYTVRYSDHTNQDYWNDDNILFRIPFLSYWLGYDRLYPKGKFVLYSKLFCSECYYFWRMI